MPEGRGRETSCELVIETRAVAAATPKTLVNDKSYELGVPSAEHPATSVRAS